ncbi:hypothetical protein [Cohnella sp. GCM10027633]|uniref:hypothetical protein n=1 Tax=unclassified Cohnella TaxID=2636738 RepID=UPI0036387BE7
MSKLEGNNRWKSKMLLTEHQEQYEARGDQTQGKATADEIAMIREAVLLPHAMTISNKSLNEIKGSTIALHHTMAKFLRVLMDHISLEMYRVRRELRQRNIKVLSDEMADDIVYHRYVCRGYEGRFGMTREVARFEISKLIAKSADRILRFQEQEG